MALYIVHRAPVRTTCAVYLAQTWLSPTRSLTPVFCLSLQVLAGALKDNKRATIAGETTFGKGLIQTAVELSDGSGLAITVARYQTPSGEDINKKGISPDVVLAPDQMPPTDGPGFCRFVATGNAPPLLAAAPA